MYKFLFLLLSFGLFTCEKPAPQKPKVLSSITYMDTLDYDSIAATKTPKKDSILFDTIAQSVESKPMMSSNSTLSKEPNSVINYGNVSKQKVTAAYLDKDSTRLVEINFPKKNLNIILKETYALSNIYKKDSVKWETKNNRFSGVLTINGTWFDFIKVTNKPKPINLSN